MEFNRNQYFMIGLVLLFIGIELRMVDSFTLNERSSKFVTEKFGSQSEQTMAPLMAMAGGSAGSRRVIKPPQWLGWCIISVGSVLILHSLAMKRPGG
ncbi:MAG: hypothetical protein K8T91_16905 [Planctomycetes bacterium]|nr:hypothetical protein [Planctomycetota bacterium]